jgi:molybdopterin-guanine dinucleotide biosynthesis protein A
MVDLGWAQRRDTGAGSRHVMTAQQAERPTTLDALDVIVLAGGRGSRLGGIDKSELVYAGAPLRQHVLSSVRSARRVVWVGESTPALRLDAGPHLVVTREEPAFAGPSAALAAGLAALDTDPAAFTLVLAADLPRAADAVPELIRAFGELGTGVLAVDEGGRRQYLLAVYPSRDLRAEVRRHAAVAPIDGLPFRRLIESIDLAEVRLDGNLCADVDTEADAARHGIHVPAHRGANP